MKCNGKSLIGAIIIGGDFQALGAIRSLAEKGVPVFLLDFERSIARYSRFVKRKAINYSLLSSSRFVDILIDLAKNENLRGWVLFPNNDETVKLLSLNRNRLADWYRNPVPSWEFAEKFYNKKYAYEIAQKLSIPIPRMYGGENLEELLSQNLEFPIVLKPAFKENYYPITKKKAIKVENRESLVYEYNKMASLVRPTDIIVQEMIQGGPKNLFSYVGFFDGERFVAGMSARRIRQHPMDFGHATTYAESIKVPALEIMARKLLKEIKYYGLAEVEFFKEEKDGDFKFIEINGRIWGWHTLAKAAGINLPYILFQHMTGGGIPQATPLEGVKWIRLITDIPTVMKELFFRRMTIREYYKSLKGRKEFAVFSFRDPVPFFMEFFMIPYLWWKRGF